MPQELMERYPLILWHRMRGLHNILAYEYFGAGLGIIWQTA